MSQKETVVPKQLAELRAAIRDVRGRYDRLDRGRTASIRRARSADEVALDGTFWRVGEGLAQTQTHLPHVVLLFPLAGQLKGAADFSFGRLLKRKLGENDGAIHRFRRVLASRDREELDHRLRGILRLATADKTPVDWGVLGVDILWFFAESDNVRRKWAQDFFAALPVKVASETVPSTSA